MNLISLKIYAKGINGWGSELLTFGRDITQLYGPNGSGKTPLIQSILFCLGYPCSFRNAIYDRCKYAELTVSKNKEKIVIRRFYSKSVDIEVVDKTGIAQRFLNELDYSKYLFATLGIVTNNLVTTANRLGEVYLASILPLYYLDQDTGYKNIYSPPSNFIKDQFSEMMRIILELPVKNSFDKKKESLKAKRNLNFLDDAVQEITTLTELTRASVLTIGMSSEELEAKIIQLELEAEDLQRDGANRDDSSNTLDREISFYKNCIRDVHDEIYQLQKRNDGIGKIIHEINTEIETLNINEEARRVFLSFDEICGANCCQLFSESSNAYSKNLLYLKDQIKDLERNTHFDEIRIVELTNKKNTLSELVKTLTEKRNAVIDQSEISAIIQTITHLKTKIFEYNLQLNEFNKLQVIEKKLLNTLNERDKALSLYNSFSTEKYSSPELIKIKADLRSHFIRWLDILKTQNISKDITFKSDFTPYLGDEAITQITGSTKVRAILAYHAAIFQIFLENHSSSFKFFILDTPKQHEVNTDDLKNYLDGLKLLCFKYGVQIVFSTTEYHYNGDANDIEWNPPYPGVKHNMYLQVGSM